MARKATVETAVREKSTAQSEPAGTTAVRNTAIPKTAARAGAPASRPAPLVVITREMIAERAYHIAMSGTGGSDFDNWVRAEHDLRRELGA